MTEEHTGLKVLESRNRAVGAVFGGGVAALAGVGLAALAVAVTGPASLLAGLGAAVVGGGGLLWMSRAVRHLLRFGSPAGAIGLTAAGVLGAMVGAWPVFGVLQLLGVWRAPLWLSNAYAVALLGIGTIVLVLTLRALLRWTPGRDDAPNRDAETALQR